MFTIFIEYRIEAEAREQYVAIMNHVREQIQQQIGEGNHAWLEGTDQENLFVESVTLSSLDTYEQWKAQLKENDQRLPWYPIFTYIIGGKAKFNMWAFQNVMK